MALAVAVRLAFVYLTRGHGLAGDEIEYDTEARLAADGHWFWTKCCFGVPHESLQKAPGYPAWVSLGYSVLGTEADRVLALQALLAPVTVGLTWLIGRRLFTPTVALVAAFVAAVAPTSGSTTFGSTPRSLATPLTLLVLLLVLDRGPPTCEAGRARGRRSRREPLCAAVGDPAVRGRRCRLARGRATSGARPRLHGHRGCSSPRC